MKILRPVGKLALVERDKAPEETQGGLVLPGVAQELPTQGRVISVGVMNLGVAPGDQVLFGKYSGQKVVVEGREFLLLRLDEILGVLEDVPVEVH